MRSSAAWIVGLALTGSSIACNPATHGLGDDEDGVDLAESVGTDDDDDDDSLGETDEEGETTGDGDPLPMCMDPPIDVGVEIQLHGESLAPEDCGEFEHHARIQSVESDKFTLTDCYCDNECDGAIELAIALPSPDWLPQLDAGSCYYFYFYAEELEPGVCRRNRVDIAFDPHEAPWYSAGSAREDLDHNGLTIDPIVADACTDACGDWQVRDVTFAVHDVEQTLGWGEDATVGIYKIVNWQSYATPSGCDTPGADVTSWTAM